MWGCREKGQDECRLLPHPQEAFNQWGGGVIVIIVTINDCPTFATCFYILAMSCYIMSRNQGGLLHGVPGAC